MLFDSPESKYTSVQSTDSVNRSLLPVRVTDVTGVLQLFYILRATASKGSVLSA